MDVEYVREVGVWYLRAYIDKEGGIAVDDCEIISRKLGEWLDKEDFIDDSYILEVSSPRDLAGRLEGKRLRQEHGKDVEVRLYKLLTSRRNIRGR